MILTFEYDSDVVIMVDKLSKQIIRPGRKFDVYCAGASFYALLDQLTREFLAQDLGEPFDPEKHCVVQQIEINKDGRRFVSLWLDRKDPPVISVKKA